MKKVVFLFFSLAFIQIAKTQTVGGVSISSIDSEYLTITQVLRKGANCVLVDYGQKVTGEPNTVKTERFILDDNGEKMRFNSFMDALNFMSQYGYEYVDKYDIANLHYFLLRKKKTD